MIQEKTIAAIATATSGGAIGMIRLSGRDAFKIADRVFSPLYSQKALGQMQGYTACMGRVRDNEGDFDEAVAVVFRAPKSYTGEDMVELTCHGGSFLMDRLLGACIAAGAGLAQPGEFTKRAFLNGKMSLDQAEAVTDLIASRSIQANRAALSARQGAVYREITTTCSKLVDAAAHLAAWVDYPDEGVEDLTDEQLKGILTEVRQKLDKLSKGYRGSRIIKEGVDTAIVGRPNVGKSTLMNLLAGSQRSIVTHIPGTTRDVVEETAVVGGILLRLSDTAGIRESEDLVEQMGVQRSRERLESCELVLAVFDGSQQLDDEEIELIKSLRDRVCIGIVNKSDLGIRTDMEFIRENLAHVVEISAQQGQGTKELERVLIKVLGIANLDPAAPMIANQRQMDCVCRAIEALDEGVSALDMGITLDAVSVCIDDAINALQELTGEKATVSVVDRVFENFCVGK